ncbi:MAG: DUF2513 domain-containing protein [Dorea sp.]|jgi:hypothetical protein|nr:DUF2513 domain-containing protein [Dorea sp.]
MQRDMDLVRKILFYVEENYVAGGPEIPVHIDGYSDSVVYEHCILMRNDGLIGRILDTSPLESKSCKVGNLTSEGFDLLDKIRADTDWNRTKSVISEKGLPLIIETIKTISTALISAAAEGVTNSILKNNGLA